MLYDGFVIVGNGVLGRRIIVMDNTEESRNPPSPLNKGGIGSGGFTYIDKDSVRKRGLTWNGLHLPYNADNVSKAKALRRNMTPAEKKLWYDFLKNFKYRVLRQRPIDHYIVDFYIPKLSLVIELDGSYHSNTTEFDQNRTDLLSSYGLQVIRFTNEEILNDFESVCKKIEEFTCRPPLLKEKGNSSIE